MKTAKTTMLFIFTLLLCVTVKAQPYDKLEVNKIGKNIWQVIKDYTVQISLDKKTVLHYRIDRGYITNFRSGPKILDIIVAQFDSNNNALNVAWLIHDVNYEGYVGDRKVADELCYAMLRNANIGLINAKAIYYGLRALGENAYSEFRNNMLVEVVKKPFRKIAEKNYELSFEADDPQMKVVVDELDKAAVIKEIRRIFPDNAEEVIAEMEKAE
jgi:hypothetical protein